MTKTQKTARYRAAAASGLQMTDRRGVAFLEGHPLCMTQEQFKSLKPVVRRQMHSRMGRWIGRPDGNWEDEKYHGWTQKQHNGAYVNCFVFKYRSSKTNTRIYGFLCNPDDSNRRFQLFVPTEKIDYKKGNPSDTAFLDRAVATSKDVAVVAAIRDLFGSK